MSRYKCIISYDGSGFCGYQIQPKDRTVQGELEKALRRIHKQQHILVEGSGRTDAGVHAYGQVIHFDSPLDVPVDKWPTVLNTTLPDDILVKSAELVEDDFHARHKAVGKEYRYRVYTSPERDPFKRFYSHHYPYKLDLQAIEKALGYFLGTHDFTSFCSAKTTVTSKIRTLHEISFTQEKDELVFKFVGNGFLYNMVRIMMGTILEVGRGRKKPEQIPIIIEEKNRKLAGKTAGPEGLYLWKVFYE
ncbi:tRNA pseudouridine synthase A [Heyndrickxia shackletonii]|uniref:tRNA pseudouridine synthase A n=1 Tax=Heyndrickxia shackletonii TaxID=157838 RepID=A0A0Q3TDH1_9BACI|nr:tRNA pseudouridine(38-40) synthase TruA [Heyndrickxia shackletonii]KQL52152.1 tRNA pseudouridine synthase A [Heyndrickxia shackletonii]NEZ01026.1 tRNA pseudouridine(38-40) synthase TruA [Heyndrickxia shackletonii]